MMATMQGWISTLLMLSNCQRSNQRRKLSVATRKLSFARMCERGMQTPCIWTDAVTHPRLKRRHRSKLLKNCKLFVFSRVMLEARVSGRGRDSRIWNKMIHYVSASIQFRFLVNFHERKCGEDVEKDCWTWELNNEDAVDCGKRRKLIKDIVYTHNHKDREWTNECFVPLPP